MKQRTLEDVRRDWDGYKQRFKIKSVIGSAYEMMFQAEMKRLEYEFDEEDGYFDTRLTFQYKGDVYIYLYSLITQIGTNTGTIVKQSEERESHLRYVNEEKILDSFYQKHYEEIFDVYKEMRFKYDSAARNP